MSPLVLALLGLLVLGPAIVCLRRPLEITLPLYAALIPFGPLIALSHPHKGNNASMWTRFGSLSSLVGVLLVVGLLLALIAGKKVSVPLSPTIPLWLLMLGVAGATTLWSLDPVHSANGFLSLGSLSLVYILISLSPIDRRILTRTENGLLVGGVAVTCYGLLQLFVLGGFPNDVAGSAPGTGGRFGNDMLGPNNEAIALLLPLFVAVVAVVEPGGCQEAQPIRRVGRAHAARHRDDGLAWWHPGRPGRGTRADHDQQAWPKSAAHLHGGNRGLRCHRLLPAPVRPGPA